MPTKFLKDITPASAPTVPGDKLVGVQGGTADVLFDQSQLTPNLPVLPLASTAPATADTLAGVTAGGVQERWTLTQIGSVIGGSGGGGAATDTLQFSTQLAAQTTAIPDTVNFVNIAGFKTPGDGGGGTYARISARPPSPWTGMGPIPQVAPPPVPPSFSSVGVPTLVYSTTFGQWGEDGIYGYILKPILAGTLAFVVIFDMGTGAPPATFTDTAGNTYTLGGSLQVPGGAFQTIYYCLNPVFAPVGTTFNLPAATSSRVVHAYTVPGFSGATLDQVATQLQAGAATGGVSITSPTLTAAPELVIGLVYVGHNTVDAPVSPTNLFVYTPPANWIDLGPPISSGNVVSCTVVNATTPVVFHPTWDVGFAPTNTVSILLTFKTFPRTALNASYWQLKPTYPLHTAAYGIDPATKDNVKLYELFGNYLASIAPPSSQIGSEPILAGRALGTVTISIANPAVVTVNSPTFLQAGLRNGQRISFQTTGALPAPLVPNKIYYVLWGTVKSLTATGPSNQLTFQLTTQPLFQNLHGSNTGSFHVTVNITGPISTLGGTQSGTHSITIYDENWVDFVLDPGLYWAGGNAAPGIGWGLKKLRMYASGAKTMSDAMFTSNYIVDQNAPSGQLIYQTQFQTTNARTTGRNQNFVVVTTPANAANFHVNSWVVLMAIEMQSSGNGNWNPYYFEYQKIQSIDVSGALTGTPGTITFYDKLQYNYKSTYPVFRALAGGNGPVGPGTIAQFADCFDQEVEVHGLSIYGVNQQTAGCMVSLKFVDCDVWGFAFKTGPTPVLLRKFTMENCRFYNFVPEVDKMIDTCEYINCTFDESSYLFLQSASINKMVIDRCRFMGGNTGFGGTAKDLTIRNSQMAGALQIGPVYGGTERMLIENCDIQSIFMQDGQSEALGVDTTTFSNGTITIAAGTTSFFGPWHGALPDICPAPWAAPGAKVLVTLEGSVSPEGALGRTDVSSSPMAVFEVLDVRTNVGNDFLIDTTLRNFPSTTITFTASVSGTTMNVTAIAPAGAFLMRGMDITGGGMPAGTRIVHDLGIPNTTNNLGAYTLNNSATIASTTFTASVNAHRIFLPHPCGRLTVQNCTGGRFFTDQAGAPPDLPMFSYFRRRFFGLVSNNSLEEKPWLVGNLASMTVNVMRAYTGPDSTFTMNITTFGWAVLGGNTYPIWSQQVVNVKTAGVRTWTGTGAPTGAVAGDTLAAIPYFLSGVQWFQMSNPTGNLNPADAVSAWADVVVTVQTDQGINTANLTLRTNTTPADAYGGTVTGATTS
jgi:hypothetical protein